jgi:hypothetical protein
MRLARNWPIPGAGTLQTRRPGTDFAELVFCLRWRVSPGTNWPSRMEPQTCDPMRYFF